MKLDRFDGEPWMPSAATRSLIRAMYITTPRGMLTAAFVVPQLLPALQLDRGSQHRITIDHLP